MVNFGLNSASILGLFLAVAGATLYFLRTVRPELSRDHDIFFAAVGLLCGFILLFQGWRLDPILQFGQFLLAGTTIFFAVETIRLRGAATEQARRNTPIVDRDRPVSPTYGEAKAYREEELDELEPYGEPRYPRPELTGYDDEPRSRNSRYEDEERRRLRNRGGYDSYRTKERPRRSRPNRSSSDRYPNGYTDRYDNWEQDHDSWSEGSPSPRRSRNPRQDESISESSRYPSSSKRRRPPQSDSVAQTETENYTNYVDYKPINIDEKPRTSRGKSDFNVSRDGDDYELSSSEY